MPRKTIPSSAPSDRGVSTVGGDQFVMKSELADVADRLTKLESGSAFRRALWQDFNVNKAAYSGIFTLLSVVVWLGLIAPLRENNQTLKELSKDGGPISQLKDQVSALKSQVAGLQGQVEGFFVGNAQQLLKMSMSSSRDDASAALRQFSRLSRSAQQSRIPLKREDATALVNELRGGAEERRMVPAYWDATSSLVSYVSAAQSGFDLQQPEDCTVGNTHLITIIDGGSYFTGAPPYSLLVKNCRLVLDHTVLMRKWEAYGTAFSVPMGRLPVSTITFSNVQIVYKGGELPPVTTLVFSNCKFEISLPDEVPPSQIRRLATGLLTADLHQISVQLG